MAWKEAATLILTCLKEKPYSSLYNYQLLMLKRSEKSSFMPNGFVFPGGAVDKSDSSPKWLQLFNKFQTPLSNIPANNLPPMFQSEAGGLPKQLALRITAIRETFEETGVLLCKNEGAEDSRWASALQDAPSWRPQVQKDPSKFLEMCETLGCAPDVAALKLWSNWLTPPDFKKRFDTAFFTACLPVQPKSSADLTEVQQLEWWTPERLKGASAAGQLWLPPPQHYELNRLMLFHVLEDLAEFASDREVQGCNRYGGERLKCQQGLIFPLPGDDLYEVADSGQFAELTFSAARAVCGKTHRLEITKDGGCQLAVSGVLPTHGHVLPLSTINRPKPCCKV